MNNIQQLIEAAKLNNGIITSKMAEEMDISRGCLTYLKNIGAFEYVTRGVYLLPEYFEDEMFTISNRFRKGIFSGETSLFLWDLIDVTPNRYIMSFPYSYNVTSAKSAGMTARPVREPSYSLGITTIKTPLDHYVNVYNMEKTLCDIVKPRSNTDIQTINKAFKAYMNRSDKNIPLLSEYANLVGVNKKIRTYLEVLL